MIRHFTASAVILQGDRVLLIEHRKLGLWLYPGGHVEANEDPVQAVRREVREEVGLDVDILSEPRFAHPAVAVVEVPFTILVEDIPDPDGLHQHIDLVYVCQPSAGTSADRDVEYNGYRWVSVDDLVDLDTPPELPDLVRACVRYVATRAPAPRGCAPVAAIE